MRMLKRLNSIRRRSTAESEAGGRTSSSYYSSEGDGVLSSANVADRSVAKSGALIRDTSYDSNYAGFDLPPSSPSPVPKPVLGNPCALTPVRLLETPGAFGKILVCLHKCAVVKRIIEDDDAEEFIACKIIPKSQLETSKHLEQVRAEERALRTVSGRSVHFPIWRGSFQTSSIICLCMNFESGGTLTQLARDNKVLRDSDVRVIARHIASALVALHDIGCVHRDVKLDNIVLSSNGQRAVLVDFGLCKFLPVISRRSSSASFVFNPTSPASRRRPSSSLSPTALLQKMSTATSPQHQQKWGQTSTRVGTVQYHAPEIVEGREYGKEVDAWALGVVVFYLASGGKQILPFDAPTAILVMDAILRNRPDYCVLEDNLAFEFVSRLFVSDPKRRMELGSSEYHQHPFIKQQADADSTTLSSTLVLPLPETSLKLSSTGDRLVVISAAQQTDVQETAAMLDAYVKCTEEQFEKLVDVW